MPGTGNISSPPFIFGGFSPNCFTFALTLRGIARIVAAAMRKWLTSVVLCICSAVCLSNCSAPRGTAEGPVVLDIGHCVGAGGARTPRAVNGKRLQELDWWYEYVGYTKKVIEDAGYKVYVCNRGDEPEREPLATWAEQADVDHLGEPDTGHRYPSDYYGDRVASGMVSADYAISRKASCAVFLHHNSERGWRRRGGSKSLIICNRYNGGRLAECLASALNTKVLNHGMPNGGIECKVQVRCKDATRAAGWMNACDDSGIPAAVVEAAFLNNRRHALYLSNPATARHYAETIGHGIVNYLRRYGNEPRHYREDTDTPDCGSFGYAAESRRIRVPGADNLWED